MCQDTEIAFRYDVMPTPSKVCNTFKASAPAPSMDHSAHKPQTLGVLFRDCYDKLIRNKRAALTWEVLGLDRSSIARNV